ncbi:MAG: small ribosomal subunit Rsm22 family protein [Spirochaetaceae bacterium]|jgi:hypothetical protein|nr:small ribosomal subunit Rsm22 family protein [Spirochaetaceae bacterium]
MKSYQSAPLFSPLSPEIRQTLDFIPSLVDETFPLPKKFKGSLAHDIAELSLSLTAERETRRLSYLTNPRMQSAYLHYFLPWNVFRLCHLLPNLPLPLETGATIVDLGSGPLTFAIALWASRPDLRDRSLEFFCIDRAGGIVQSGKKLFSALATKAGQANWRIRTVKADVFEYGFKQNTPYERATLICAINMFNEGLPARGSALRSAEKAVRLLKRLSGSASAQRASCKYLVLEPGVPQYGAFIESLRYVLAMDRIFPLSPCPHHRAPCPFLPECRKWCHFTFGTEDAPETLLRLSASAGLPKERATLSFLFAGQAEPSEDVSPKGRISARILSDAFPLPDGSKARYGCSKKGLVLVRGQGAVIEKLDSGHLCLISFTKPERRDSKSGALFAFIKDNRQCLAPSGQ